MHPNEILRAFEEAEESGSEYAVVATVVNCNLPASITVICRNAFVEYIEDLYKVSNSNLLLYLFNQTYVAKILHGNDWQGLMEEMEDYLGVR